MRIFEILLALSIMLIAATFISASLRSFEDRETIAQGVNAALGALQKARADSLASRSGFRYGVHFDSDKAVVFPGSSYIVGSASNTPFVYGSAIVLGTTTFAGGGVDVLFDRLTGTTGQYGTLTLRSVSSSTLVRTLIIRASGAVYAE